MKSYIDEWRDCRSCDFGITVKQKKNQDWSFEEQNVY